MIKDLNNGPSQYILIASQRRDSYLKQANKPTLDIYWPAILLSIAGIAYFLWSVANAS